MKDLANTLQVGDKFYFPATNGIALICEVAGKTEKDVVVWNPVNPEEKLYIQNESVNSHALPLDGLKSQVYVHQRIEDPENKIVYLRYQFKETWIDKLYNFYCKIKKRIDMLTL